MTEWPRVSWTQARQILAQIDPEREDLPPPDMTPATHLAMLTREGRREDATIFIGHALQRCDAVQWAMAEIIAIDPAPPPARAAVRTAIWRWLEENDESTRRQAHAAGEAAPSSPEQLLAQAVFFSGGSIAPPDLPVVNPAPDLTGRLAAAAVLVAAHHSEAATEHLQQAIERGVAAAGGSER